MSLLWPIIGCFTLSSKPSITPFDGPPIERRDTAFFLPQAVRIRRRRLCEIHGHHSFSQTSKPSSAMPPLPSLSLSRSNEEFICIETYHQTGRRCHGNVVFLQRSGAVMAEGGSMQEESTPLSAVANAFEELARSIKSGSRDIELAQFSAACSLVSVLFGSLGVAFKFAEMEYVSKVQDLLEASKTFGTLENVLDHDLNNDTVRKPGSHSRNLRRVRQGLDLIRALFEQFISTNGCSLKDAATTAYAQVCAPYHTWAVRKAVFVGMYALPTREQLILKLNETDGTVQKEMERYITACSPIIKYIDNLYTSKHITLDW